MPERLKGATRVRRSGAAATGALSEPWAPSRRLAIAFLLLPLMWGCALLPHRGAPVVPGPAVASTPDTTRTSATEKPEEPVPPAPVKPSRRAPASTVPREAPAPAAAVVPADSVQKITVQLSPEEREELLTQADEDFRLAQERLDQVDVARMTPGASERLDAVRALLASVADARSRNDIRTAALLARKARLLAQDLPKK